MTACGRPGGHAGNPDCGPRVGLDVVPGAGSNVDMASRNPSFDWGQVDHMAHDNWFTDCLFEYSLWVPMNICDQSRAYSMWMGCKLGGDPNHDGWGNPTGHQWVNVPERIWCHDFHIVRCYHKGRVAGAGSNVCEQVKDSYAVDSTNASGAFMRDGKFGCTQTGCFANAQRPHTALFPAASQWDWVDSGTSNTPSPYDP